MNFNQALGNLPINNLSDVEYIRLVRMGYSDSELQNKGKQFYNSVIEDYNETNKEHKTKSGRVNQFKVLITQKQVSYLESFGFTFTEHDLQHLKDGDTRNHICIINYAIKNKRFVKAFSAWLATSSRDKEASFSEEDILVMREALSKAKSIVKPATMPKPALVAVPDERNVIKPINVSPKRENFTRANYDSADDDFFAELKTMKKVVG